MDVSMLRWLGVLAVAAAAAFIVGGAVMLLFGGGFWPQCAMGAPSAAAGYTVAHVLTPWASKNKA